MRVRVSVRVRVRDMTLDDVDELVDRTVLAEEHLVRVSVRA